MQLVLYPSKYYIPLCCIPSGFCVISRANYSYPYTISNFNEILKNVKHNKETLYSNSHYFLFYKNYFSLFEDTDPSFTDMSIKIPVIIPCIQRDPTKSDFNYENLEDKSKWTIFVNKECTALQVVSKFIKEYLEIQNKKQIKRVTSEEMMKLFGVVTPRMEFFNEEFMKEVSEKVILLEREKYAAVV